MTRRLIKYPMAIETDYIIYKDKRIFYRSGGRDKTNPLILIHGLAGDSRLFHNQLKFFASYCRVIAPDLPGHGKSEAFDNNTVSLYSEAVNGIIEYEGLENIILLGHSMGGAMAIQYYLANRARVKALILVSTSHKFNIDAADPAKAEENFESFYKSLITGSFSKKAGIFLMASQNSISETLKNALVTDLKICAGIDFGDNLSEIKIPALIIANRDDAVLDSGLTEEMSKKIEGSRLVIFNNSGHVPFFEESTSFNLEVKKFMETI